jgi:hypothetical protein
MNNVPVGVVGTIVSCGERFGWSVKVEDDSQNTSGFLILEWRNNPREAFDSWVENREGVDRFFQECGWEVDWSD